MLAAAQKNDRCWTNMHTPILRVVTAFLAMLWSSPLIALDPHKTITQYGLDRWTRTDGLPQNTVGAILQTRDGYLWLGTDEGLARFDGVRFTLFNSSNTEALVEQDIRALFEDRDGTLWVATTGYLVFYRGGRWASRPLPKGYGGPNGLHFHQAADGGLWVSSGDRVGTLHSGVITDFRDSKGDSLPGVASICETGDGSMWFGFKGLSRLKDGVFSSVFPIPDGNSATCAVLDHKGAIWFGTTRAGLGRLKDGVYSFLTTRDGLSSNVVTSLLIDRDDNLWMGTLNGGLHRYRDGRLSTLSDSDLHSNQTFCLFEDREGSVWIGTNGGGLSRLRDGRCATYSTKEGLSGAFVQALSEGADGSVWIGTAEGGLSRLVDGKFVSHYAVKDGLSSNFVMSLWNDRQGTLWIGTDGGLNWMSDGKIRPGPPGADEAGPIFFSIFEDHGGVTWVGTNRGLWQYRGGKFTHIPGITDFGMCIKEDRRGALWVGTNGGGLKCLSQGRVLSFTTNEGLSNNVVVSLHEDEAGVLWIGTAGGGLNRYRDGKFARITTRHGLPSDSIFQILQDTRGNLWMSCNNGIFCASKRDLDRCADGSAESVTCISFDESDGMRNRECNGGGQTYAMKARDGALWFATVDGAVRIDPNQLTRGSLPPPVHVERMVVNDRVVGDRDGGFPSVLPPGSSRLELAYTGLSFVDPRRVRFRYKLYGLDDKWVEGGTRRQAFYTNVPPGRYTFRVVAANSNGVWNDVGASVSFRVRPHFYQAPWFYALVALALMGAAYGAYRYRVQQLLELERVRVRIAADLHDEIGAGLTHVAIINELIQRRIRESQGEMADLASTAAETARGLVDSLTDVVWAIDPKMDNLESLAARIRKFSSRILEAKGIRWGLLVPEGLPNLQIRSDHRRQVLLIFKEAINNIVRHASCSAVNLQLDVRGGCIVGEIADDGQGFDSEHVVPRGSGRGLASMRERASRLGGSLSVTSEPGRGTHVSFSIPL